MLGGRMDKHWMLDGGCDAGTGHHLPSNRRVLIRSIIIDQRLSSGAAVQLPRQQDTRHLPAFLPEKEQR
jgi:hypothetical protein